MLYFLRLHFSHFIFAQTPIYALLNLYLQVFGLLIQKHFIFRAKLIKLELHLSSLGNHFPIYIPQHILVHDTPFVRLFLKQQYEQKYCRQFYHFCSIFFLTRHSLLRIIHIFKRLNLFQGFIS